MRDWLIHNIVPLLAIAIVGSTITLYILSAVGIANMDPESLRSMKDLAFIVTGFYFGSSIGSKEKTRIMNEEKDK